jgi:hypothetical protein
MNATAIEVDELAVVIDDLIEVGGFIGTTSLTISEL